MDPVSRVSPPNVRFEETRSACWMAAQGRVCELAGLGKQSFDEATTPVGALLRLKVSSTLESGRSRGHIARVLNDR